jgi:hypothetical protein
MPPVASQCNGSGGKPWRKAVEASLRKCHLVPSTVNPHCRPVHAVASLSNLRSEATADRQLQRGSYFHGDCLKNSFKGELVKCRSNEIRGRRRQHHSRITAFAKNPAGELSGMKVASKCSYPHNAEGIEGCFCDNCLFSDILSSKVVFLCWSFSQPLTAFPYF